MDIDLSNLEKYAQLEIEGKLTENDRRKILIEAYSVYRSEYKNARKSRRVPVMDMIKQFSDPLSEVTRKERKNLLTLSLLVLIIIKVGLFPTKIEAFGIEFKTDNISAFFAIFGLVILYLLIVFIVYCLYDIRKWMLEGFKARNESYNDELIPEERFKTI